MGLLTPTQIQRRERLIHRLRQLIGQGAYDQVAEDKARRVITTAKAQCEYTWFREASYRRGLQMERMGY